MHGDQSPVIKWPLSHFSIFYLYSKAGLQLGSLPKKSRVIIMFSRDHLSDQFMSSKRWAIEQVREGQPQ